MPVQVSQLDHGGGNRHDGSPTIAPKSRATTALCEARARRGRTPASARRPRRNCPAPGEGSPGCPRRKTAAAPAGWSRRPGPAIRDRRYVPKRPPRGPKPPPWRPAPLRAARSLSRCIISSTPASAGGEQLQRGCGVHPDRTGAVIFPFLGPHLAGCPLQAVPPAGAFSLPGLHKSKPMPDIRVRTVRNCARRPRGNPAGGKPLIFIPKHFAEQRLLAADGAGHFVPRARPGCRRESATRRAASGRQSTTAASNRPPGRCVDRVV